MSEGEGVYECVSFVRLSPVQYSFTVQNDCGLNPIHSLDPTGNMSNSSRIFFKHVKATRSWLKERLLQVSR